MICEFSPGLLTALLPRLWYYLSEGRVVILPVWRKSCYTTCLKEELLLLGLESDRLSSAVISTVFSGLGSFTLKKSEILNNFNEMAYYIGHTIGCCFKLWSYYQVPPSFCRLGTWPRPIKNLDYDKKVKVKLVEKKIIQLCQWLLG